MYSHQYKTKISERINESGQTVRLTQRYLMSHRRPIKPFGDAKDCDDKDITIKSKEKFKIMTVAEYTKSISDQARSRVASEEPGSAVKWVAPHLRAGGSKIVKAAPIDESTKTGYRPPNQRGKFSTYGVKISNIDEYLTSEEFEDVVRADLKLHPHSIRLVMHRGERAHLNKGFAFLNFITEEQRDGALECIDGQVIGYQVLSAEIAKK